MARIPIVAGSRILDWVLPGELVVNPGKARDETPCRCIEGACFHSGILGPLGDAAKTEYCKSFAEFEEPVASRVRALADTADACPLPTEEGTVLDDIALLLQCLCKGMREKGLDVCGP